MILTVLLNFFYALLGFLVDATPTGHLPSTISSAFAYFVGVANLFSYVVPVGTLLAAALVILAFDGAVLGWHFLNWVIRKIPGMS